MAWPAFRLRSRHRLLSNFFCIHSWFDSRDWPTKISSRFALLVVTRSPFLIHYLSLNTCLVSSLSLFGSSPITTVLDFVPLPTLHRWSTISRRSRLRPEVPRSRSPPVMFCRISLFDDRPLPLMVRSLLDSADDELGLVYNYHVSESQQAQIPNRSKTTIDTFVVTR